VFTAGEWSDDRRSGQGHYFYANGDEYMGEWQNHLRHGQGRYMYASSGLQYEGQWRDGKRTGDGEITRIGGNLFILTSLSAIAAVLIDCIASLILRLSVLHGLLT